jgi:hypothetical protein
MTEPVDLVVFNVDAVEALRICIGIGLLLLIGAWTGYLKLDAWLERRAKIRKEAAE